MLLAHALAPLRKVLEDRILVSEIKSCMGLLVLHHVHNLQHKGLPAAVGLREALLQQLFPLLQRLSWIDGVLLLLVAGIIPGVTVVSQIGAG